MPIRSRAKVLFGCVCASSDSESSHSFCLQSPKRTPTKSRTAPKSTVDAPNEEEKWRKW